MPPSRMTCICNGSALCGWLAVGTCRSEFPHVAVGASSVMPLTYMYPINGFRGDAIVVWLRSSACCSLVDATT